MKINAKVLSIPPYISTSWENVISLQMCPATHHLIVMLKSGSRIAIPGLSDVNVDEIFLAHAEFIEQSKEDHQLMKQDMGNLLTIGLSQLPSGDGMDSLTNMIQHDPSQKDAPLFPPMILSKIVEMIKGIGLDLKNFNIPEGEPHCSCPFCQISKAIHKEQEIDEEKTRAIEEEIKDTELTFREWDIMQVGEKLYDVSSPFDKAEHYQVYLGDPIGCTCGKNNCKHIVAVLNS